MDQNADRQCSENYRDEVDFLPANKHESFLYIDYIPFGVPTQACPKYPKQGHYFCNKK